jgi:hypothetical protein
MNLWEDKMWKDPIVEELHKIRRDYAKKFNFDPKAIFDDLKQQEKNSELKIVSFPIRKKQKPLQQI